MSRWRPRDQILTSPGSLAETHAVSLQEGSSGFGGIHTVMVPAGPKTNQGSSPASTSVYCCRRRPAVASGQKFKIAR